MNAPIAFDTETLLIRRGLQAPPMVCMSVATEDCADLVHHTEARSWIEALLESDQLLVGAYVAFDFGVIAAAHPDLLPQIFEAYEQDRVTDVLLREKLQHIAMGVYRGYESNEGSYHALGYALDDLTRRRLGRALDKSEDSWRLRYGELLDVPLSWWPEAARQYAVDDAQATLDVYTDQQSEGSEWLADEFRQARASWWLHLMRSWGLMTDPKAVEALARRLELRYAEVAEHLEECGLLRVEVNRDAQAARRRLVACYQTKGLVVPLTAADNPRMGTAQLRAAGDPLLDDYAQLNTLTRKHKATPGELRGRYPGIVDRLIEGGLLVEKDVRNTKAAAALMRTACAEKGLAVVLTEKEGVKLDRDTCERVGHPDLEAYAELSGLVTKLSNFVTLLESGTRIAIQARFESLLETGRTSSSPNVQNLPRKGGVRECFIPRPGMVYASADYSGVELRTWAQVCLNLFGQSRLAEALNRGFDPHLEIGRRILGIAYDEALSRFKAGDDEVDNARQVGKVANFGFMGGLGAETFVVYARKSYGVHVTLQQALDLKKYWLAAWPEALLYFEWIGNQCDESLSQIEQHYVGRFRANVTFCQACNTLFQGLAADGGKRAGFLIAKACYVDTESVLYGSRPVNFIHDEFILETPDTDAAHDVAVELARLMVVGMSPYLPDVPPVVEPLLMRRWSKKAKPVFDGDRRVPWDIADIAA